MKHRRSYTIIPVLVSLTLLTACEQSTETAPTTEPSNAELASGLTVKEQIEARQAQLKKMGKAFKTISDQLKSDKPDIAQIQAAAAVVPKESATMLDWFPTATGPESGVKTEALPAIWNNKEDFNGKVAALQDTAAKLDSAAQTGDIAAISAAFQTTGGTCKACHDKYRMDD